MARHRWLEAHSGGLFPGLARYPEAVPRVRRRAGSSERTRRRRLTISAAGLTLRGSALLLAGVDGHLHATVLRPASVAVVRRDRLGLAEAARPHAVATDALRREVRHGGGRASLGEPQVVRVRADAVGMTDDQQVRPG